MKCQKCGHRKFKVLDKRNHQVVWDGEKEDTYRRKRECQSCGHTGYTQEVWCEDDCLQTKPVSVKRETPEMKRERLETAREKQRERYASMTPEERIEIGKRLQNGRENKREYTPTGKATLQRNAAIARLSKVKPKDDIAKGVEAFLSYSEKLRGRAA